MKRSGYWFKLLLASFVEPRLERFAKSVKSKFEWVVCIVNHVLRRSVKIHMHIPQVFFSFPEPLILLSVMNPYTSASVGPVSPCGTSWFTRGDKPALGSVLGIYHSTAWQEREKLGANSSLNWKVKTAKDTHLWYSNLQVHPVSAGYISKTKWQFFFGSCDMLPPTFRKIRPDVFSMILLKVLKLD